VTPRLVGLVADDLTGATDAAVQFAAVGWPARLLLRPNATPEISDKAPSLLAVATGLRAAGDDEAAAGTARAVRNLLARGCDRLYVKIDSTLRGSVAGQLRGALAAWAPPHAGAIAVLCPAFPDQGRTVVGGQLLVGGVPLARSAAAADPVTPVVESRLDRLVPAATAATLTGLGLAPPPPREVGREAASVVFVDASTDADLDDIAASLDRLGPQGVAAGSAGLAAALARRWCPVQSGARASIPPAARILVGVSSLHPVAMQSVERLRAALAAGADPPGPPAVDVISTPSARTDTEAIAAGFGDRVAEQLVRARYDTLVLVGGDGAAAILDRVNATAIAVHEALAPGVPIGTILGGEADGVRVVTKSGGFGHSDCLVRIIDRLQGNVSRRREHS
jgi:D-threonate/D-erythronate kinase